MTAKSLGVTICSGLLAVIIAGVSIFAIANWDKIKLAFAGTSLYTREDVDNAYKDGYSAGNKDGEANEQKMLKYLDMIEQLQKAHKDCESTITNLHTELQDVSKQLTKATEDVAKLQEDNAKLSKSLSEAQAELTQVKSDLVYYRALVEAYEDYNIKTVTYYINDTLFKIVAVERGGFAKDIRPDSLADYNIVGILGWSLDRVNVIDLTTYPINQDTVLYAVPTDETVNVEFLVNGKVISSQAINKHSDLVVPDNPDIGVIGYRFAGWCQLTPYKSEVDDSSVVLSADELYDVDLRSIDAWEVNGVYTYKFAGVIEVIVNVVSEDPLLTINNSTYVVYRGASVSANPINLTYTYNGSIDRLYIYNNDNLIIEQPLAFGFEESSTVWSHHSLVQDAMGVSSVTNTPLALGEDIVIYQPHQYSGLCSSINNNGVLKMSTTDDLSSHYITKFKLSDLDILYNATPIVSYKTVMDGSWVTEATLINININGEVTDITIYLDNGHIAYRLSNPNIIDTTKLGIKFYINYLYKEAK